MGFIRRFAAAIWLAIGACWGYIRRLASAIWLACWGFIRRFASAIWLAIGACWGFIRRLPSAIWLAIGGRWLVGEIRAKATRWWTAIQEPPYVVEFDVPGTFTLADSSAAPFKGLLYREIQTRVPASAVLITYWKNSAVYDQHADNFKRLLGAHPRPLGRLLETDSPTASRSLWRRIWDGGWTLFPWLLAGLATFAAVIGNVTTVSDFFGKLYYRPQAVISMAREDVDVLAYDEYQSEGELRNISGWVNSTVVIQGFSARNVTIPDTPGPWLPTQDFELSVQQATTSRMVGIAPGASEKVKIYGTGKKPGIYQLKFDGETERRTFWSGEFGMARDFRIRVWPRRYVDHKEFRSGDHGRRAEVTCEFMIGDEFAKGFRVEASLDKTELPTGNDVLRDTRFGPLSFPFNPRPTPGELTDFKTFIKLTWDAQGIPPRKRTSFTLYLENAKGLSDDDWGQVVDKVEIKFGSPRDPKEQ